MCLNEIHMCVFLRENRGTKTITSLSLELVQAAVMSFPTHMVASGTVTSFLSCP
jgi:hypothetical protein